MTINITGHAISRRIRCRVAGLRAEAWSLDPPLDGPPSGTETGDEGTSWVEFEERLLCELFREWPLEVFFKVFRDDGLLASTEGSVVWRLDDPSAEIVIEMSLLTEAPIHSVPGDCAHMSYDSIERACAGKAQILKEDEIVPERNDKIDNWQGNNSVEGVISG